VIRLHLQRLKRLERCRPLWRLDLSHVSDADLASLESYFIALVMQQFASSAVRVPTWINEMIEKSADAEGIRCLSSARVKALLFHDVL
jgi:hypothetical protein